MKTTKQALLRKHPRTGAIEALSSNGRDIYQVTIGEHPSCTCPAGQNGRRCYHLAGAEQRYPAFYPVPTRFREPAPKPRADASLLYA